MRPRPPVGALWAWVVAVARWRPVSWEAFEALLPTNELRLELRVAVPAEQWIEIAPPARWVQVRNLGAGKLEVNINDAGWAPLERAGERAGVLRLDGHEVRRVGLRTATAAETLAEVMYGRRI